MDATEIESIVLDALTNANRAREAAHHLAVSPDAIIFGPGSPLDSLGLVALLMDIEDNLRDRGVEVNLSDARAVSATRSPFRDVPSLVRFIGDVMERAA
jgi:acyl carrier protein